MKKQAKQIFWNAILLTAASLLMRTVGVAFGVAVSNRAGAEAMGLYSLLSGVYGFALTIATSGIHLGVTRVLVDRITRGKQNDVRSVMKKAVFLALFCGGIASFLLFSFAKTIGCVWLKDARTVSSLRLLAITLPLISLSSVFGGYFTAVRRPYQGAFIQVAEQACKIFFTMQLLAALIPGDAEGTCRALVLGGTLAEILSFLLEFLLYLRDRRRHFPGKGSGVGHGKKLVSVTAPVALTTYVRSALLTLEHILIPEGLRNSGSTHAAALVAYGSIHSMALPIILYPAALVSSFSGLLVPAISECEVRGDERRIRYMVSRVFSLSLFFSVGVAGIMVSFSEPLGRLLYPNTQTGEYIRILAPLIPIMYVDTATDAILKGLGEQVTSMKINIADALLSVILVLILLPKYGITGYLVTIYCSETFNTVLSIERLLTLTKSRIRLVKWVYAPLLSAVLSTGLVKFFLQRIGKGSFETALSILLPSLLTFFIYLFFLLLFGSIGKEELHWGKTLFARESGEKEKKTSPPDAPTFVREKL